MNLVNVAKMIDHTALKPETTKKQIETLCQEAIDYQFIAVCVNPTWVKTAYEYLKESNVKVATVIGFPLGANTTETKIFETKQAIEHGATEIDMVINIGDLKGQNNQAVKNDIQGVVEAAQGKAIVKVIIETCLLTDEEKIRACQLAVQAGADFVKTSTGFSSGGATEQDVALMRKTVGPNIGVKASGGIKDFKTANKMIEAGASRIGASAGVKIVKEALKES